MPAAKYKRVLLKLSGEALRGGNSYGIDNPTLVKIALQIKRVTQLGVGVGIVVGDMDDLVRLDRSQRWRDIGPGQAGPMRPVGVDRARRALDAAPDRR